MTDGLFEMEPEPREVLTAGERRRHRVAAAVEHGDHPLALAFPHSGLRVNADPELTCGSCRFRSAARYPKCWRGRSETPIPVAQRTRYGPTLRIVTPFITHGPATDVLASWPACQHHEPKETE